MSEVTTETSEAPEQSGSSWKLPAAGIAALAVIIFSAMQWERMLLGDSIVGAEVKLAPVVGSDDYTRYARVFGQAAGKLVSDGRCTEEQISYSGGFTKSQNHKSEPIYFTLCGNRRIYVDVVKEKLFE